VIGTKRIVLQEDAKLPAHVTGIARNLADDVAFEVHVVARSIQRDSHTLARALGCNDPGQSDLAGVVGRHDLSFGAFADAPLGRPGGVHDALQLAAFGESR